MKMIGVYKTFKVYQVDGKYVRDNLSTDFSEWGSHATYNFIPQNQLWIEYQDDFSRESIKPLIIAAYTEYMAIKNGYDEDTAYNMAVRAEDKERKHQKHFNFPIKIKKLAQFGNISVWLVNGEMVRDKINSEFAEGGHGLVYHYIPVTEIWLDDAVIEDALNIFVHELTEYNLMLGDESYDDAHATANKVEHIARKSIENRTKILNNQLKILLGKQRVK